MLAVSADLYGTMAATVITSLVGVGAYMTSRRTVARQAALAVRTDKVEEKIQATDEAVEIERVKREGWVTLLESLREQYGLVTEEASGLRLRLRECHTRFDDIEEKLRGVRRDHERAKATLASRIDVLRAEVTRLGGNVDEINRVGKRGPRGAKGETGDKGATA